MENNTATINNYHQRPSSLGYKISGGIVLTITAIALATLVMVVLFPQVAIIASAIALLKGATLLIAFSGALIGVGLIASIILLKKGIEGEPFVGAGVLPYCVENGVAYFLLSQEANGTYTNQWCDFGGSRDFGEDPWTTASREAKEESKELLGPLKGRNITQLSNRSQEYLYYTFFVQFQSRSDFQPIDFANKTVTKGGHHDEKSDVRWVKARDVWHAVMNPTQIGNGHQTRLQINKPDEKIRGSFAKSLVSFYTHDKQLLPQELQFT